MNTNSNSYTIIYASVLVIIVAGFRQLFPPRPARKERRAGYEETDSFFAGHPRSTRPRSQVCRSGEERYVGGRRRFAETV